MNVYYTSDLHLGHRWVAELREFATVEAHDRWLTDLWDSTVHDDDQMFLLGDLTLSREARALEWVAERPGRKHFVTGNHDPCHPMHRGSPKALPRWLEVFESVQPFLRRRLNGREFLLSHFPYHSWGDGPDRPGARYEQYRLPDLGMPLLHGHTHSAERGHGHMLHVGIDAWKTFVPQAAVIEWLGSLPEERP